jgi:hypothetical protein
VADQPTVQVVCLLRFSDEHSLRHKEASAIALALRKAIAEVLPDHRVAGCWVHEATPGSSEWTRARAAPKKKAPKHKP